MEYNVLRTFKAPDGSGPFNVDGKFKTDDERLAKSLIDAELIEGKKKKPESKPESKEQEKKKPEDKQVKKVSTNKKKKPESETKEKKEE